jgi:hypothetical protein
VTDLLDKLKQATVLLGDVARIDHACLSDEEVTGLLVATEAAGRLADTARAQVAAEVDARSGCELGSGGLSMRHGHRKPVHLIEMCTRVSQSEAAQRIRLGIAIRPEHTQTGEQMPAPHPHVARAMIDGSLGLDAATAIVQCLKQARLGSEATPQRMDAAERSLVNTARTESADLVAANMRTTGAVTAIITLDNLESGDGIGWLDDSNEPLPASVIQEMACDSGFRRVLLGNTGEPLYEGRLEYRGRETAKPTLKTGYSFARRTTMPYTRVPSIL